jgi:hypothetical protein
MSLLIWQKQFTDAEAIADRLEKRLQIGGAQNAFGKSVLNDSLLNSAGAQVEARITATLSRCYRTPLKLTSPQTRGLLASIAEKAILAEILPPQFVGEYGKEGGLRYIMATEFAAELAAICPGGLRMMGELLLADANTETGNHTVVGKQRHLHQHRAIEGERYGRYGYHHRPDADSVKW